MTWKKPEICSFDTQELASQIIVKAESYTPPSPSYPTFKDIYLSGLWNGYRGYAQGYVVIGGQGKKWKTWYINCYTVGVSHRFRTPDYNNNEFKYLYPDSKMNSDDYAAWFYN